MDSTAGYTISNDGGLSQPDRFALVKQLGTLALRFPGLADGLSARLGIQQSSIASWQKAGVPEEHAAKMRRCLDALEHYVGDLAAGQTVETLLSATLDKPQSSPVAVPRSEPSTYTMSPTGEAVPTPPLNSPQPLSDDALAYEFTEKHHGKLLYVAAWGCWMRWDGCRWTRDETTSAFDLVRLHCRTMSVGLEKSERLRISKTATIAAVERLAKADQRHACRSDQFDADPWLLNTPAGVVDLRSGECHPHYGESLHTKVTGASPVGSCPRFLGFLHEVFQGDQEMVSYAQRWAGYLLTGITREHAFLFVYGPGGNGKSVLLNTLAAVLGDYATTASSDLLTVSHNEQHPTHLASLRGARMVLISEVEEGSAWAEARLKRLTGGDPVSARVMRGDLFQFTPQLKLVIAGNYQPALRNPDQAMMRRLHLVPMTFVPAQVDLGLPEELKAELSGILAWMIAGCLEWQRLGLKAPAIVREAGSNYFADADNVGSWIAEHCERVDGARLGSQAAFQDWAIFAKARNEPQGNTRLFSEAMRRHVNSSRQKYGVQFLGIRLRASIAEVP